MTKRVRQPASRGNHRALRQWSVPTEHLGEELVRSLDRVMSLLGRGRFGDPDWARAVRRETRRWPTLAKELDALTPPPVARQTHEAARAWFRASVDFGTALVALIEAAEPDPAEEAAVARQVQVVRALQAQATAAAAALGRRLRLAAT